MKEERISSNARRIARINEKAEDFIYQHARRIARINKKAGHFLYRPRAGTPLDIKIVSEGKIVSEELKTVTDELEGLYKEDPYIFLWAAKRFMDEKMPNVLELCSRKYSVYFKSFLNLLSSAKNLKYEDLEQENSKKLVFLNIINQEYYRGTLLYGSIVMRNDELAIMLIDFGGNVNENYIFPDTLLMEAVRCERLSLVKYLIASGAKIYAQDFNGDTALHIALARFPDKNSKATLDSFPEIYGKKIEIVKSLLFHDYAIIPNNEGKTAYDIAKEIGLTEIVKIMESKFFDQKLTNVEVTPVKSMNNLPITAKSFISK